VNFATRVENFLFDCCPRVLIGGGAGWRGDDLAVRSFASTSRRNLSRLAESVRPTARICTELISIS
jgi:hypothetical protein